MLNFIRHPSASSYMVFKSLWPGDHRSFAPQRLQAIIRAHMMRRTKHETLMGQPIINLPKKRIRMVELG